MYLFLDDIRTPEQAFAYTNFLPFKTQEWQIVRSHNEFIEFVGKNGLPEFISFDHDLADSHYTPEHLWTDYDKSKEWQDAQKHTEKTGFDSARWLVDYCLDNELECPRYYCHSMNPVGKDKIIGLLDSFTRNCIR